MDLAKVLTYSNCYVHTCTHINLVSCTEAFLIRGHLNPHMKTQKSTLLMRIISKLAIVGVNEKHITALTNIIRVVERLVKKEISKEEVRKLVENYEAIIRSGKKAKYSEADVGSKFILPLLKALGWDITKLEDVKEQRRTLTGVADYSLLNIGSISKIFLELKKFEEKLDGYRHVGGKIKSYPQIAIDYAWQSRSDWAVLTNFEETRLYYSRVKKPQDGLIFKLKFSEYLTDFDKLWLLSKESATSGLLDTYEKRRLRREINEELLKDWLHCRKLLVPNIRKNNPKLSKDEINETSQKILDRIMFIRSCEDRLIIPAESLWSQFSVWQKVAIDKTVRTFMMDLKNIFRDFDAVYNGKLFAPHPCEDLTVDNKILEIVLTLLYNYNFDLIPVDVLGSAYELYIGTIIKEKEGTLKENELTLVEDPSVRKKHGIYYTPESVVDYIVRNTLGTLLKKCKTVEDVSKIKVLDPACGSGSFLIKAFDVFKEWYDRYNKQNKLAATSNTLDAHLPLIPNVEERILNENLYGVDLDPQAVEITILNLSLKAIKTRKKLPFMGDHIKTGNSIVSGTVEEMMEFFGKNWQEKKPFKWNEEFPEVFEQGGFDVIIGNPPYYSMETRTQEEQKYFRKSRPHLYRGKNDVYYYFMACGIDLLKDGGMLGFIVERYWVEATYGDRLREAILNNACIVEIIDFGKLQVFRDSGNHTSICIFKKNVKHNERINNLVEVVRVSEWNNSLEELLTQIRSYWEDKKPIDTSVRIFELPQNTLDSNQWILATSRSQGILQKIRSNSWALSTLCEIEQGQKSGLNKVFSVTQSQISHHNLETQILRKMIKNSDIRRYYIDWKGKFLIYTTGNTDIEKYPNIEEYLKGFYKQLIERAEVKDNLYSWYRLQRPRRQRLFDASEKIVVPYRAPENRFAYDDQQFFNDGGDIRVIVPKPECTVSIKYILGCLNSKVLNFFYCFIGRPKGEVLEYFVEPLSKLQIRRINLSNPKGKKTHDDIVELVNKMLSLSNQLGDINTKFDRYLTEPIMAYTSFRQYYYKLEVKDKEALDKTSKGTVRCVKVEEKDAWLTFKVDYFLKTDKRKQEFTNIPVLKCKFEQESFRKFLLYAFRSYKKRWGSGNLLSIILNVSIPCFDRNPKKNGEIIKKIMKDFLKAIKKKEQLEKEFQETDKTLDAKAYELYGLDSVEIAAIEDFLKLR